MGTLIVPVLFDTNILIDHLNDVWQATKVLKEHRKASICPITWMEVMVGTTRETEADVRALLAFFRILPLEQRIYEKAVILRKKYRMKLPDALIYATARVHKLTLFTRDNKDFPVLDQDITVPYRL